MKKYIIPFIIGLILMGVGSCYLVFEVLSFEEAVYQEVPKEAVTESFSYPLENNVVYNIAKDSSYQRVTVIVDDTLINEVMVSVTYNKYLGTLIPSRYLYSKTGAKKEIYSLNFNISYGNKINPIKQGLHILREMVSEKVFYNNIASIYTPKIEVRISTANKDLLMINGSPFTNIRTN